MNNLIKHTINKNKKYISKIKHLGTKKLILLSVGLITIVSLAAFASFFYVSTQQQVVANLSLKSNHPVKQPIIVKFNQSLTGDMKLALQPKAEGEWQKSKQDIFGVRQMKFVPTEPLRNATDYQLTIAGAERVATGEQVDDIRVDFRTEFAPGVSSVSPWPDTNNVMPDTAVKLKLSQALEADRLTLKIKPKIKLKQKQVSKQEFSWQTETGFKQGQKYQVKFYDGDKQIAKTNFQIVAEPQFDNKTKSDNFYPDDSIKINFKQPMQTDIAAVRCDCSGQGEWQSETVYRFKPTQLKPGQTIKYYLPKGLTSKVGGQLEKDYKTQFKTTGQVSASVYMPGNSHEGLTATITFDQAVNRASVEQRLQVVGGAKHSYAWLSDKKLQVYLSELDYQTRYSVTVAAGVQPKKDFGLASNRIFKGSTVTEMRIVQLNVPQYYQNFALSCELSSLRMALARYGIYTSDEQLLQRVGYPNKNYNEKNNTWGDPYSHFIGDVHGSQSAKTGYGVYAPPIAAAAQSFGRSASSHTGVSARFLAEQIYAGNPVVIWGSINGSAGPRIDWKTSSGKKIGAWVNQHAKVVYGVKGSKDNPQGFYLRDPITGSMYWSTGFLMNDLNTYGNLTNQAVVVR